MSHAPTYANNANASHETSTHSAGRSIAMLALIVVAAMGIRLLGLGRESFWFDETIAAFLSQASISDILNRRVDDGGNPQGFWMVGHLWQSVVGASDIGLRLLPLLIGVTGVAAMYALGKQFGGASLALLTAALFAINPNHIYLSQEYRVYTLMQLLSIAMMASAYRYDQTASYQALGSFVLAAVAGFYSHYYAALTVCAVNVWMLRRWRDGQIFWKWCAAQVAILILIVPLIQQVMEHTAVRVSAGSGGEASKLHLAATPLTVLFGRTLAWKGDPSFLLIGSLLGATLVLAASLGFGLRRPLKGRGFLYLCTLIPLLAVVALAFFGGMQSWDDRKAMAIIAPLLVLVAHGLLTAPRGARNLLVGVIALGSCASWLRYTTGQNRDNWRDLSSILNAEAKDGDAVLVIPDYELFSLDRYLAIPLAQGKSKLKAFGYRVTGEFATLGPLGIRSEGYDVPASFATAPRVWVVRNRLVQGGEQEEPIAALHLDRSKLLSSHQLARSLEVSLFLTSESQQTNAGGSPRRNVENRSKEGIDAPLAPPHYAARLTLESNAASSDLNVQ